VDVFVDSPGQCADVGAVADFDTTVADLAAPVEIAAVRSKSRVARWKWSPPESASLPRSAIHEAAELAVRRRQLHALLTHVVQQEIVNRQIGWHRLP
jgi:hypothetical protein